MYYKGLNKTKLLLSLAACSFFLSSFSLVAEDEDLLKKSWEKLLRAHDSNDKEKILECYSGELKNRLDFFGEKEMKLYKKLFSKECNVKKVFLTEGVIIIHFLRSKKQCSLLFKEEDKKWKAFSYRSGFSASLLSKADLKLIQFYASQEKKAISSNLTHIYEKVRQFAEQNPKMQTIDLESMGLDSDRTTYKCPRTEQEKRILVFTGYQFRKSPDYVLAVTESALLNKHLALFEDGKIKEISKKDFKKLSSILDDNNFTLDKKSIKVVEGLIIQLGDKSFKKRKKAKNDILKFGYPTIKFLKTQLELATDIEIKESLREIITELKKTQRTLK